MKFYLFIITIFCACQSFGIEAEIEQLNGNPALFIDGKPHVPMMMITTNPVFGNRIINNSLQVSSPEAGDVWKTYSQREMPADMILEGDIMMASPTGPDAGVLFRIRRSGGEYLIGLNRHGSSTYIKFVGAAVGPGRKSVIYNFKYEWKLGKTYRFHLKLKDAEATLSIDGKLVKKVKLPEKSTTGALGITAFRCRATYGKIKVTDLKGKIYLEENWNSKDTSNWKMPAALKALNNISKAGIDIFQISLDYSGSTTAPEKYDFTGFDERCRAILTNHPKAKLIVRLWLDFPASLHGSNPQSIGLDINGKIISKHNWSFSDQQWRNRQKKFVAAMVKYFDSKPWGKNVIGVLLASGHGGEFVYHFTSQYFHDYSKAHQNAFIKWLRVKYANDIALLNQNWNTHIANFESIKLPSPSERVHFSAWKNYGKEQKMSLSSGHGMIYFFPDAIRTRMNDFLQFHNECPATLICELTDVLKAASQQKRLVGVYYGYSVPARGQAFNKGHNALETVLKSKVDFIASPYNYRRRGIRNPIVFQLPMTSALVNNKLPFMEDDTRTVYCAENHDQYLRVKTLEDTVSVMKRNFAAALQHQSGLWFLDFGADWFAHQPLVKLMAKFKNIYEQQLQQKLSPGKAEVVILISEKSFNRMYHTADLVNYAVYEQILNGVAKMGAPFDLALTSDLDKLKNYKLYVFVNAFYLGNKEREMINSVVKNGGKTALWIYAPGLILDREISIKSVSKLTGIKLQLENINAQASLRTPEEKYVFPQRLAPVIYANDTSVKIIGEAQFKDIINDSGSKLKGTLSRPGLVVKKMKNWTSIYSSVPNLPPSIMRKLAEQAGVRIYSASNSAIYAGTNWLAIHASQNGRYSLKLPVNCSKVQELFSGEIVKAQKSYISVDLLAGETRIWKCLEK